MLTALKLETTWEYVSRNDPSKKGNADEATVFVLGALSSRVVGMIRDGATQFIPSPTDPDQMIARVNSNAAAIQTVEYGLRGWRNLRDSQGNEVKFETQARIVGGRQTDVVASHLLDLLSLDLILELSQEITRTNALTEEEKGN